MHKSLILTCSVWSGRQGWQHIVYSCSHHFHQRLHCKTTQSQQLAQYLQLFRFPGACWQFLILQSNSVSYTGLALANGVLPVQPRPWCTGHHEVLHSGWELACPDLTLARGMLRAGHPVLSVHIVHMQTGHSSSFCFHPRSTASGWIAASCQTTQRCRCHRVPPTPIPQGLPEGLLTC